MRKWLPFNCGRTRIVVVLLVNGPLEELIALAEMRVTILELSIATYSRHLSNCPELLICQPKEISVSKMLFNIKIYKPVHCRKLWKSTSDSKLSHLVNVNLTSDGYNLRLIFSSTSAHVHCRKLWKSTSDSNLSHLANVKMITDGYNLHLTFLLFLSSRSRALCLSNSFLFNFLLPWVTCPTWFVELLFLQDVFALLTLAVTLEVFLLPELVFFPLELLNVFCSAPRRLVSLWETDAWASGVLDSMAEILCLLRDFSNHLLICRGHKIAV